MDYLVLTTMDGADPTTLRHNQIMSIKERKVSSKRKREKTGILTLGSSDVSRFETTESQTHRLQFCLHHLSAHEELVAF